MWHRMGGLRCLKVGWLVTFATQCDWWIIHVWNGECSLEFGAWELHKAGGIRLHRKAGENISMGGYPIWNFRCSN